MFTKQLLLPGLLLFITTSTPLQAQLVKTVDMPLNDSLKTGAAVYKVKQKFSFSEGKATMHFGPYLAQVKFDLLRVKSRSSRFGSHGGSITTTYSKQRNPMHFSFQLADSARNFNSYTTCTNEIERGTATQPTYRWIRTFLGSIPEATQIFAGSILIRSDTINADPADEPNWNFVIYTTSNRMVNDSTKAVVGIISNDDQRVQINMTAVTGYSMSMPAWMRMSNDLTGYEFRYNNRLIGATELVEHGISKGRVWLKNDLPDDLKFLIANVVEALMAEKELGF